MSKDSIGVLLVDVVIEINYDKLRQLNWEFCKDKPKFLHKSAIVEKLPQKKAKKLNTSLKDLDFINKLSALQNELIKITEGRDNMLSMMTQTEKQIMETVKDFKFFFFIKSALPHFKFK